VKKNYKMKKTISMKQFISEFGNDFSKHMKQRLLELEERCVLTRKEDENRLDLKHVEHIKYNCCHSQHDDSNDCQKEYAYGQLVMNDGSLYFSEKCVESPDVMQAPVVNAIYNSLDDEDVFCDSDIKAKKVDDSNIDYVMDKILNACPEVSKEYLKIISKYR
jgi:hypothetical protein